MIFSGMARVMLPSPRENSLRSKQRRLALGALSPRPNIYRDSVPCDTLPTTMPDADPKKKWFWSRQESRQDRRTLGTYPSADFLHRCDISFDWIDITRLMTSSSCRGLETPLAPTG